MKKFVLVFLFLMIILTSGYRKPYKYSIDAGKDAFLHNNIGINYLQDRIYYAAIQEFKIAINLSPNTQATAIFKNNLGETYIYIGYPDMARVCFEDAIENYWLNLQYYINLAECYKILNIVNSRIDELSQSSKVSDKILLGILYTKLENRKQQGIYVLDEICITEPDLLITPAIRNYIENLPKEEILPDIPDIE